MRDVAALIVLFLFSPVGDIGWFTCWCARPPALLVVGCVHSVLGYQTWMIVSQEEENRNLFR
jgi:hypothetical protein